MKSRLFRILIPIASMVIAAQAATAPAPLVVTASNAQQNQLLVYDAGAHLLQTLSTQGQGGVSGNAGGVTANGGSVAVVNFGSQSVAMFAPKNRGLELKQLIPTLSSPVSVAFGANHLYILGTATVESHRINGSEVSAHVDGSAGLLAADGSAAQVGVLPNALIISEKSNVIETVALSPDGEISGTPVLAQNIPANVNAPFGLVTRGNDAYVTIAHADELSLVRNGTVLTVVSSVTQHAPCWVTLAGPFLFAANTTSMTVSRYAVYGQKIVQDAAVAAAVNGNATDIAAGAGLLAVIDGGAVSHVSIFGLDEDGNLTLQGAASMADGANGVAIVWDGD